MMNYPVKIKEILALKKKNRICWREDMAFLHHFFTCYKQFKKAGSFPKVNFENVRWISLAIYT